MTDRVEIVQHVVVISGEKVCSASLSVPVLLIKEPSCHTTHMAAAASTSASFALHVCVSNMEENKLLLAFIAGISTCNKWKQLVALLWGANSPTWEYE